MRVYNVNLELFDKAVSLEYRMIDKFWDHEIALEFKDYASDLRVKIVNETATQEELLKVAELMKKHLN
ncbi:hypothetical protein [Serratia phage X20]|uniref:Uncharacterized protein n=1 Tax=Serratia phage X20 TaxID=2006942 RepID=A0A1Z1LYR5_9CAUD|nr:hypothetical protein KNT72_gp002 [Serratia phage X20]ARW57976.1 hypothetical protein [Serratia phage X20]UJJ21986.1 hypothetical protein [Erwinia phage Virsaitis27]